MQSTTILGLARECKPSKALLGARAYYTLASIVHCLQEIAAVRKNVYFLTRTARASCPCMAYYDLARPSYIVPELFADVSCCHPTNK